LDAPFPASDSLLSCASLVCQPSCFEREQIELKKETGAEITVEKCVPSFMDFDEFYLDRASSLSVITGNDSDEDKRPSTISRLSHKIRKDTHHKLNKALPEPKHAEVKGTNQNIIKNYVRAIISFAASDVALPHLKPLLLQYQVSRTEFYNYVLTYKDTVDSIRSLVNFTNESEDDEPQVQQCK